MVFKDLCVLWTKVALGTLMLSVKCKKVTGVGLLNAPDYNAIFDQLVRTEEYDMKIEAKKIEANNDFESHHS